MSFFELLLNHLLKFVSSTWKSNILSYLIWRFFHIIVATLFLSQKHVKFAKFFIFYQFWHYQTYLILTSTPYLALPNIFETNIVTLFGRVFELPTTEFSIFYEADIFVK